MDYTAALKSHLGQTWKSQPSEITPSDKPLEDRGMEYLILEYPPYPGRKLWCYTTCGMGKAGKDSRIEVHLFSETQDQYLATILTMVWHYNLSGAFLDTWHSVNFGIPWQTDSLCTYGLLSPPYLDGPAVEDFSPMPSSDVACLWLIPVTEAEITYRKQHGTEALEDLFEEARLNFHDPGRNSLI